MVFDVFGEEAGRCVQRVMLGDVLVGINPNFGDVATLSDITIVGDEDEEISICDLFEGNDTGDEPTKIGEGPNGTDCVATGIVRR